MTDFPTYMASIQYIYTPESYLQDCIDEGREPSLEEWQLLVQEYAYEDLGYVGDPNLEVMND